jgi:hypothetical protein
MEEWSKGVMGIRKNITIPYSIDEFDSIPIFHYSN